MRRVLALLTIVAAAGLVPTPASAVTIDDPARYVNPFVGTKPGGPDFGHGGGAGNTYPGANAPFGMLQWSPDTVTKQAGGYAYDDNRIRGFSLTHISGPGCDDYGNIPFLPILGTGLVSHYPFSHANEAASPGTYSVTFDNGLRTELAADTRGGVARFTYPGTGPASLMVDVARALNNASGSFTVSGTTISGYSDGGGFCGAGNKYRVHFSATFDRPIIGYDTPTPTQPILHFDTSGGRTVTARLGISFVSVANAAANRTAEIGTKTFEQVRDASRAKWNALLGRIAVGGGTDTQRRVFYTALYHSLLFPQTFNDVNGQYVGFDEVVHTTESGRNVYATYSGWDVHRSQLPLIGLLDDKIASDIGQSLFRQVEQSGYLDRWTLANGGTGVMVGDPLSVIGSTMYAFGGTDFDAAGFLQRAVAASDSHAQRPGHVQYFQHGYVPNGTGGVWGPAATSLEYYSADFALSALARRLGQTSVADDLLSKAQGWRNLANNGWIQHRNADGSFGAFDPASDANYVEGNGAQYTWMVPFNHAGLFGVMGGNAGAVAKLDTFFTKLNAGPHEPYAYLGNEPSANTPWAYVYAGAPAKAQDVVRRALLTLYKATPDGEAGNDDLGQMSAWAVWAALGMYPQVPGRSELVLASPQFSEITIRRGNGATISVTAPGASDSARYVRSLTVNGAVSSKPWLSESFVASGGTLAFTLGTSPSSWGSAPADAPPSYDVTVTPGGSGPVVGLASKCVDVANSSSTDGTAVQLYTCNGSTAQRWTVRSDHSLSALGKCLDVVHSGLTDGVKVQLWTCNRTNAQVWVPQPNGSLRNPNSGRCLDIPNSQTADGTRLQIWTCNGTNAQRWTVP